MQPPIPSLPVVLGSQSPRRRELLGRLLPDRAVEVVVPRLPAEPGFEGARTLAEVDAQLLLIARLKHADVCQQVTDRRPTPCVVAADTVIVGLPESGVPVVLGKPPDAEPAHRHTVHQWFRDYFAGRRHLAKTAVCVGVPGDAPLESIVTTEVWFRHDALDFLDWYLSTGEPRGKAGGYAIQEAGSLFVDRVVGSLSNVVGLPLVETLWQLRQAGAV